MSRPLQALYEEHESIAAVLHALHYLTQQVADGQRVDPKVFHQILYYLDVFPERVHHPREDSVLFHALAGRSDEADAVIARLEAQHEHGAAAIRNVEQALLRWESGGEAERQPFVDAATTYVQRYRAHMRLEEDELMPLARRLLSPADWVAIEAAFATHDDPLKGTPESIDPVELFQRILHIAPPPIGFGKPAG